LIKFTFINLCTNACSNLNKTYKLLVHIYLIISLKHGINRRRVPGTICKFFSQRRINVLSRRQSAAEQKQDYHHAGVRCNFSITAERDTFSQRLSLYTTASKHQQSRKATTTAMGFPACFQQINTLRFRFLFLKL